MIKKGSAVLLLITTIVLLFPLAVKADIIFEPSDSFYEKNIDKMRLVDRRFYANNKEGFISLKKEPGSNKEVASFVNGTIVSISFTYHHRGQDWGIVTFRTETSSNNTGWVSMEDLVLVYDNTEFLKDFEQECYNYDGDYEALFEVDELIFWTWPGSGVIAMTDDNPEGRAQDPALGWLANATKAYKDDEEREWLYISYYFANKSMWVCLSDPGNGDIPAFNSPPELSLWPPMEPGPVNRNGWNVPVFIIILVAVVAIGTLLLIRIFWKSTKNDTIK